MNGAIDFHPHVSGEEDMAEMGYVLHPDYWGQGFGTVAASAFIRHGLYRLGLSEKVLNIGDDNQARFALAHELGFTQETRPRA
ncbi:GNAT family N-acetyltransferase [Streptococcus hyointestinalis]|uniref:GNAT family N-acetyltransferase n=1 Tax=Streptococcus hyointestinalis TaxID=1337 RepID=UPI0013E0874D|nr:GNAT family N-acetyltransferase [Streptococcus hyointestinalis]